MGPLAIAWPWCGGGHQGPVPWCGHTSTGVQVPSRGWHENGGCPHRGGDLVQGAPPTQGVRGAVNTGHGMTPLSKTQSQPGKKYN